MSLALAWRCIREADQNGIRAFSVGENGDALLNPKALGILRDIRAGIPNSEIALFSNFASMSPDISSLILREQLVDRLTVNVDGISTYERTKRLPYARLEANLLAFLEARGDRTVPLTIQILPLARYTLSMIRLFGRAPAGLPTDAPDETALVRAAWLPRLNRATDQIVNSPACGWAHRELCSDSAAKFACPNLDRVEHEAFIAPNGDWYLCCLMDQQNVVIGNLWNRSLAQLADDPHRATLIRALRERRYEIIGYPCICVQACQAVEA
jgi:hypothetical protein